MKYFIISFVQSKTWGQRGSPLHTLISWRHHWENKRRKQGDIKPQFACLANNVFFFLLRNSLVHYIYDNHRLFRIFWLTNYFHSSMMLEHGFLLLSQARIDGYIHPHSTIFLSWNDTFQMSWHQEKMDLPCWHSQAFSYTAFPHPSNLDPVLNPHPPLPLNKKKC